MATQGPNSPGTMADAATVGTLAWTNPDNAKVSDSTYAHAYGNYEHTHYLKATNFGFSIPVGAIINGIKVEIKRVAMMGGSRDVLDDYVQIIKSNGSIGTTNKKSASLWGTTEIYASYGSSSDSWGETWFAADINSANFGIALAVFAGARGGGNDAPSVDHIRITVYYTAPSSFKSVNSLAKASVKSIDGLATASVKNMNGLV